MQHCERKRQVQRDSKIQIETVLNDASNCSKITTMNNGRRESPVSIMCLCKLQSPATSRRPSPASSLALLMRSSMSTQCLQAGADCVRAARQWRKEGTFKAGSGRSTSQGALPCPWCRLHRRTQLLARRECRRTVLFVGPRDVPAHRRARALQLAPNAPPGWPKPFQLFRESANPRVFTVRARHPISLVCSGNRLDHSMVVL